MPQQRSRVMRLSLIALLALSMSSNLYAQSRQEPGAPTKSVLEKIARLLDQSGYSYTKVDEGVWTVKFKGKAFSDFNVMIFPAADTLVVMVVVAEKKSMKGNPPEMMYKLLKSNFNADFVKIGLDDDDDFVVRADLRIRTLDLQEFKETVEQVAAFADQVFTTVRPFMTAP